VTRLNKPPAAASVGTFVAVQTRDCCQVSVGAVVPAGSLRQSDGDGDVTKKSRGRESATIVPGRRPGTGGTPPRYRSPLAFAEGFALCKFIPALSIDCTPPLKEYFSRRERAGPPWPLRTPCNQCRVGVARRGRISSSLDCLTPPTTNPCPSPSSVGTCSMTAPPLARDMWCHGGANRGAFVCSASARKLCA